MSTPHTPEDLRQADIAGQLGNLFIRGGVLADPYHPLAGQVVDILVEGGTITSIASKLTPPSDQDQFEMVDAAGVMVCPGFIDLRCTVGEPGYEHRETLASAAREAALGGFTRICVLPNTNPIADNKSVIAAILGRSEKLPVQVLPYGGATVDLEGKEIAEYSEMLEAGAVGFSQGDKPFANSGALKRAAQYAAMFGATVHSPAFDPSLAPKGQIHEGEMQARFGMVGIPPLAELLGVERDLAVLNYVAESIAVRHHFSALSTPEAIIAVAQAIDAQANAKLSAAIPALNLWLCDQATLTFDTNAKVYPPLRDEPMRNELIDLVKKKEFISICSDHTPIEPEGKYCEFDRAAFGAIGLRTAVSIAFDLLGWETAVMALAHRPSEVLGFRENMSKKPMLEEGKKANFSFVKKEAWKYEKSQNASFSANSPLFGTTFAHKPVGIWWPTRGKLHGLKQLLDA